jgi:hypothetical protein
MGDRNARVANGASREEVEGYRDENHDECQGEPEEGNPRKRREDAGCKRQAWRDAPPGNAVPIHVFINIDRESVESKEYPGYIKNRQQQEARG